MIGTPSKEISSSIQSWISSILLSSTYPAGGKILILANPYHALMNKRKYCRLLAPVIWRSQNFKRQHLSLFYSSAHNESESENSDRFANEVAQNTYIVVRGQNQALCQNEISSVFQDFLVRRRLPRPFCELFMFAIFRDQSYIKKVVATGEPSQKISKWKSPRKEGSPAFFGDYVAKLELTFSSSYFL